MTRKFMVSLTAAAFLATSIGASAQTAPVRAPAPVTEESSELGGEAEGSAVILALIAAAAIIAGIIIAAGGDDDSDLPPISR